MGKRLTGSSGIKTLLRSKQVFLVRLGARGGGGGAHDLPGACGFDDAGSEV